MPAKKPTLALPSDEQLLAAIDRAQRHNRSRRGAALSAVKEHLGLPHHGWSTRQLRPQLDRLLAGGQIEQTKHLSFIVWTLTATGHGRLGVLRRAGKTPVLPESPQHRIWRESHTQARQRIDDYRAGLHERLTAAIALLEDTEANSQAWIETSNRLAFACERLASVIYCAGEWPEPNDDTSDQHTPWHHKHRSMYDWDDA
ncbi:MAG TPA: hypothetical protein VL979_08140 [Solirubrobacteraceae bacterium]|nr:hypothetical protein [Solirubrobacteraceae bacterium]